MKVKCILIDNYFILAETSNLFILMKDLHLIWNSAALRCYNANNAMLKLSALFFSSLASA